MCRDPCESLRFITNPVLRLSITTPRLKEVKENNTDPGWREDDSCLTTSPVQTSRLLIVQASYPKSLKTGL
ncbi:hypothetical protein L596_020253 [Steinernema carpocapsae]|uniref:Uncharacterized protein n=1 Tax=Steinernema carpocapsae TaxID=34508 RepID=A0A4U5MTS6_STECR|nr:hypothetical protein L596_020253 [Steinernema carpocapsae]